jgi:transposase
MSSRHAQFDRVKRLTDTGLSDYKVAALTGVPRGTVRRWRHRAEPPLSTLRGGRVSSRSADIRGIFTEHCELLGIRVTQSNHRNLSVSHRESVAILEALIGPKT